MRVVHGQPPSATGRHHGLAWARFDPPRPPDGAVVVLHGADSVKENQFDFARAASIAGLVAVCFDARGHGDTGGVLGDGVMDDVAAMADLARGALGPDGGPLALRGSSMGGYLAILAAARLRARAVVAICPASSDGLWRGLRGGELDFPADVRSLEAFLAEHPLEPVVERLEVPLLLLHAEGDERVPVAHSRELARIAPRAELLVTPGGHHRSIQHDGELQGESLRFIVRAGIARDER